MSILSKVEEHKQKGQGCVEYALLLIPIACLIILLYVWFSH